MKKILHVIHGLNLGGAENFIFNLLGAIDSSRFRFDFAVQEPEIKHTEFKRLIEAKGGKIFIIPDFLHNPAGHARALKEVLDRGYDFVHIHMNAFINPIPAIVASRFDCQVVIHSHSTRNGRGGRVGKLVHRLNKAFFLKKRYVRLSCSAEASRWMFGSASARVISNAIDVKAFAFSPETRRRIRAHFGLGEEFVMGQVGRLIPLKNQTLSINVLAELKNRLPDSGVKLMLLGEGPMEDELRCLVRERGLENDVIFAGAVHNANEYYSAFDCFLMPSWFEGLALVAVEAQAAGLRAFVSDSVTREVNISGSVEFLSIKDSAAWASRIARVAVPYDREAISESVRGSGFDSSIMARTMEVVYGG